MAGAAPASLSACRSWNDDCFQTLTPALFDAVIGNLVAFPSERFPGPNGAWGLVAVQAPSSLLATARRLGPEARSYCGAGSSEVLSAGPLTEACQDPLLEHVEGNRSVAVKAKVGRLEKKVAELREQMAGCREEQLVDYRYRLDMSWIHHDAAIEGIVYEPAELLAAINEGVVSDSSLIPVYDEIRQYKSAIDFARTAAQRQDLVIDLTLIRELYLAFSPEERSKGGPQYRKDMPLHRQYFHEIAQPEDIEARMAGWAEWVADENNRRTMHTLRFACRAHFDLLQIFPYTKNSGRIARMIMNTLLMHAEYPPVILHATDRQGYYEALRHGPERVSSIVRAALLNDVNSTIRFFERQREH